MILISSRNKKPKFIGRRVRVKPLNPDGQAFDTITRSNEMPGPNGTYVLVHGCGQWVEIERLEYLDEQEASGKNS